ncbi:DapH/DapD/GlmU-related protein [Nitratireductor basaltis]|uniref:Phosphonate metabolim protein, transferase hexapeptide repeat family n=1 Tax=Nitratireductor basaltis TaxID=472175 RepID=A0A084U9S7_9HYPH|nr:DapH/DapD/GlmU-related protein [Nitratireductor basaltis]KFB09713.1 Phosphonate metabolim protein, transferase hexapeptide repeat family [Nitratireductor basaltis]
MENEDLRFTDPQPRIHSTATLKGCKLGRYSAVGERVVLRDVQLGDFSYFERHAEAIYSTIGRFCSIAANSRINALEHPMERVTTHKITYRPNEYFRYLGVDGAFRQRRQSRSVSVGHDVWIGHGAVIMPGVSIGHGAVVGANSVVTRDVDPYTVVAGVPATKLRDRFAPDIAERLMALGWWDWSDDRLFDAVPDMQTLGISQFLDKWEKN